MPADLAGSASVSDPTLLVARVSAITILEGQVVSTNLLASTEAGGQFSILKPNEKVTEDSPFWRAVAITVPDERAVAGLVMPGMTVDVFVTATVAIPETATQAGFYTDKSTKVTYQGLEVLAKNGTGYVIRVPLGIAEEIEHLQATGAVQFSIALRPAEDTRIADAGKLGATTNLVIERYGLPVPMTVPTNGSVVRGTTNAWPFPTMPPVTTVATTPGASPQP
jgi:Flp pilus assembly protein CpaB